MAEKVGIELDTTDGRSFKLSPKKIYAGEKICRDLFLADVLLSKKEFCQKCLSKMEEKSSYWQQATAGPIAGWEVKVYRCTSCGYEYEESKTCD